MFLVISDKKVHIVNGNELKLRHCHGRRIRMECIFRVWSWHYNTQYPVWEAAVVMWAVLSCSSPSRDISSASCLDPPNSQSILSSPFHPPPEPSGEAIEGPCQCLERIGEDSFVCSATGCSSLGWLLLVTGEICCTVLCCTVLYCTGYRWDMR